MSKNHPPPSARSRVPVVNPSPPLQPHLPFRSFFWWATGGGGREDPQTEATTTNNDATATATVTIKIASSIGVATNSATAAASSAPDILMMAVLMTSQTQLHPSIEPNFFNLIQSLAKRTGKEEVPLKCTNTAFQRALSNQSSLERKQGRGDSV